MSALSYGCQSCSTIESFNGSLQGVQQESFGHNNSMVNHLIEENNFQKRNDNMTGNNMLPGMNNPSNSGVNNDVSYNADLRQNNYGGNNYNQPQMNNQNYGNGNNMSQHPMNTNYNDVKVPQVIGASAKPVKNNLKQAPVNYVPTNNNIVYDKDEKKLSCYVKLGLVLLIALAVHETIKYYINHAIKFNEGSPTYYVYYSVACFALFFVVTKYVKLD